MSKLYEALKNLEKRNSLKIEQISVSNKKPLIENRQKYLFFLFLFLVIIISGAGLVYLVEWHFNKEIAQSKIQLSSNNLIKNKQNSSLKKEVNSKNTSIILLAQTSKSDIKKIVPKVSKTVNSEIKKHQKKSSSLSTKNESSKKNSLNAAKKTLNTSQREFHKKSIVKESKLNNSSKLAKIRNKSNSRKVTQENNSSFQSIAGEPKEALLVMAEEARQSGNYQEAIRYYRLYLRDQRDPQVLNNLGALLLLLRQKLEAVKILEEAYQLKRDPEIAFNLVLAYLNNGETKKACQIIQEVRQENSILSHNWQVLFQNTPCNQYLSNTCPSREE